MNLKKQKWIILQEKLENQILYGLSCEWKAAILILDPPDRNLMHIPLFSLSDMKGKWGYWSHEKFEISLSRNLVLNHSWDSVREILLHEIAHQYADIVLCNQNEIPHGPGFMKACHLLRANPKASSCYPPLDERASNRTINVKDKILIKVKKLLALAESQNRHEAEAAMAKAQEFMLRYNLDLLEPNENRNFISIFLGKPSLRHNRADYLLAHILNDFYFVQGIWVSAYVLGKGKMGRVLEINGTIQNIQFASYIYEFVRNFIDTQWRDYNSDKSLNHYRKIDFAVGILEGFRSKLTAQEKGKKTHGLKWAVMKAEDPWFVKYLHYKYPHTATVNRIIYTRDEKVVKDGKSIGKELIISKGITEKTSQKRFLIGN
jgi:hypothetical protein